MGVMWTDVGHVGLPPKFFRWVRGHGVSLEQFVFGNLANRRIFVGSHSWDYFWYLSPKYAIHLEPMMTTPENRKLPKDFLWGFATGTVLILIVATFVFQKRLTTRLSLF